MIPLQIFEKHPTADAYRVGGFYSPYALVSADKRFTEAELAAEYWSACVDYEDSCKPSGEDMDHEAICNNAVTLERFATLPHFDA